MPENVRLTKTSNMNVTGISLTQITINLWKMKVGLGVNGILFMSEITPDLKKELKHVLYKI